MAKRQNRRSISVRGLTYQRIKNWCERNDQSISSLIEDLVGGFLDSEDEPVPTEIDPPRPKPQSTDEIISQHFTF